VCHFYAWLRLTCAEAALRDFAEAVAWSRRACELTQWQQPHCLDTLAAAHAARGEFAEAAKYQEQAVNLLPPEHQADYHSRLEFYRQRRRAG
jgi:tetratricopeptide (TPR) repeat protein